MSVTLSGLDWKAFLDDTSIWTPDSWVDDEIVQINGVETENWERPAPEAIVKVIDGRLRYEDKEETPLVSTLKSWLKKRNTVILLVETTREFEDAARFALKTAKLKTLN